MKGNEPRCARTDPGPWNRVFEALAAEPRRRLLFSLSKSPDGEPVFLPDGVVGSDEDVAPGHLELTLRHVHLPKLAKSGYVRWETGPLRAYRGPDFEEVNAVGRVILDAVPDLPESLRRECELVLSD